MLKAEVLRKLTTFKEAQAAARAKMAKLRGQVTRQK